MNSQSEYNPDSYSQFSILNSSIEVQSQFDSTMVGYSVYLKNKKKWLEALLKGNFFVTCDEHEHLKKNDKNAFCIDCEQVLCQHCIISDSHQTHQLLQIRRYVYRNVIRQDDMQKYFDCSKLQLYKLNGADVVFLNPRPQPKAARTGCNCETCSRQLTKTPNRFCSIACKIAGTSGNSPQSLSFETQRGDFSSSENLELLSEDHHQDENEYHEEDDDDEESKIDRNPEMLKPKRVLNKRKSFPRRAPLF